MYIDAVKMQAHGSSYIDTPINIPGLKDTPMQIVYLIK